MERKQTFIKTIFAIIIVLIGIAAIVSVYFYNKIYSDNTKLINNESLYIYIPSNAKLNMLTDSLSKYEVLNNKESFLWVVNLKKFTKTKGGKYKIVAGMSNNDLVNMFRSGAQTPIKLTFNNIRTKQELASKISAQLEIDSTDIINLLNNKEFLKPYKFSSNNIISMFIPNTYEFYWNTSAKSFFKKMNTEYNKFWNDNRLNKAKKIKMTKLEVSTLASIVQAEQSIHNDEKSIVAGLYINRLKKGMALESDPTIIYALGDFSIRRVLNKDKKIDSPYNTYMYRGLPPAPINLPEISSIDAVLNYKKHNYIFMCAKEDFSGYHNFANSLSKHLQYARRYQNALNKKKIWR